MDNTISENFLAKLIAYGSAFVAIFLISGSVTDPVNTPKLLALGIVSTSAITVVIFSNKRKYLINFPVLLCSLVLFLMQLFISCIMSDSPISQNIYGSYGRNNGLLMYIFLVFLLVASLSLKSQRYITLIINSLLFAGIINISYNLWVILFGDFIGWNNPYGNILGTFGNPNFIGAFLGILFSVLFALVLDVNVTKSKKVGLIFMLPICLIEIWSTEAIQGRVVAFIGVLVVLFLYIRSRYKSLILRSYSLLTLVFCCLSLAGALQKGPFASYIYKTSVSLRGQYWLAAWNTGQSKPFTGVGMDAFGDWYRRMRDVHALELPGVNTVVNTAHNVPLDFFAFGGWPLFLLYIIITSIAGLAMVRIVIRTREFNGYVASIVVAWIGYQLQSIISINQIGLAIWGWLLSGILIAYEMDTRVKLANSVPGKKNNLVARRQGLAAQIPLLAFVGGLFGFLIAAPPFVSDMKWREAQVAQSLPLIEKSMQNAYFNPQNSQRFIDNIDVLERSKLYELSRIYALKAVKWNPDSFDLWKLLYLIQNSTNIEKELAIKNMKRLDPLNPDVTAIK